MFMKTNITNCENFRQSRNRRERERERELAEMFTKIPNKHQEARKKSFKWNKNSCLYHIQKYCSNEEEKNYHYREADISLPLANVCSISCQDNLASCLIK